MERRYPCGEAEVSWSFRADERRPRGVGRLAEIPAEERARRDEENEVRAQRRARAEVRRKVLTLGADHLVTCTVRENIQDRGRFLGLWGRFERQWRRLGLAGYVAAIEAQKRGSLHVHVAVSGRQQVKVLRRLWWAVLGGRGLGNIDVQGPRPGRAPWRLARYLAKYITKDPARRRGEKRYLCSQGIEVPEKRVEITGHHPLEGAWSVLDWLMEQCGKIGLVLVADRRGWACSWGDHEWIDKREALTW